MKDGKVKIDTGINHESNLISIDFSTNQNTITAMFDEKGMEKLINDLQKTLEIYRTKRVYIKR